MRRFVKAVSSSIVMQAVLSVLLGLFLTMWPQATTVTVVYLFAAYLAITGIVSLISYARHRSERDGYRGALATGILMVVLALVVFVFPEAVAGFFSLILGIVLVMSGVLNAVRSVELRLFGGGSWLGTLIVSIAIALGGVVIIVNPFDTTVTFVLVLGLLLVAKGVIDLVVVWLASSKSKAAGE
ncbi:HdeD family acid-resistance protein [Raoultibacter massiliensis]|uniref:DUF308 domain-containing protein n=1 Tax=Raoultibacter massiliensis TaxID=1852371 RepID=A0ABV1JE10_9ACTN